MENKRPNEETVYPKNMRAFILNLLGKNALNLTHVFLVPVNFGLFRENPQVNDAYSQEIKWSERRPVENNLKDFYLSLFSYISLNFGLSFNKEIRTGFISVNLVPSLAYQNYVYIFVDRSKQCTKLIFLKDDLKNLLQQNQKRNLIRYVGRGKIPQMANQCQKLGLPIPQRSLFFKLRKIFWFKLELKPTNLQWFRLQPKSVFYFGRSGHWVNLPLNAIWQIHDTNFYCQPMSLNEGVHELLVSYQLLRGSNLAPSQNPYGPVNLDIAFEKLGQKRFRDLDRKLINQLCHVCLDLSQKAGLNANFVPTLIEFKNLVFEAIQSDIKGMTPLTNLTLVYLIKEGRIKSS